MPHTIKIAPEHYAGLKPTSRAERQSLLKISGIVGFAIAAVACFWLLQQHWQQVRELNWKHASGTIEQVRPVLMSQIREPRYAAEVLVTYPDNGDTKHRWITIRQVPKSRAEIDIETEQWAGKKCIVLWNPSDANQIDAEIN